MSRFWIVLGWGLALLLTALVSWMTTLYQGWPWWWLVPMSVLGCLALWGLVRLRRAWMAWRLRRRLGGVVTDAVSRRNPAFEQEWRAGLASLRGSRLGRLKAPLSAQPWWLLLEVGAGQASRMLAGSGLACALQPTSTRPGEALNWWFLEHGVALEPRGRLAMGPQGPGEWRGLLQRLSRVRRREPINGIVLVLDITWLLSASGESLRTQGHGLRQAMDELSKAFALRPPIYLLLSGAECLPGFSRWAQGLEPEQRAEAFGLFSQQVEGNAGRFLDEIFSGLSQRVLTLQLSMGMSALPQEDALQMPGQLAGLRAPLEALLVPAFDSNPYRETPLLGGLFLTAELGGGEGPKSGFTRQLFEHLLPSRRSAGLPVRGWSQRATTALLAGWLLVCGAALGWVVYVERETASVIANLARGASSSLVPMTDQEADDQQLRRYQEQVIALEQHERRWIGPFLPLQAPIKQLATHYRERFVAVFAERVLARHLDHLVKAHLDEGLASADPAVLAAWVQHVVRRINLLNARLDRDDQRLHLPLPGPELARLSTAEEGLDWRLGAHYRNYLLWQPRREALQLERERLVGQLTSLRFDQLPVGWLLAWAQDQSGLQPIGAEDVGMLSAGEVRLPQAFTLQGRDAVRGFLGELARAGVAASAVQRLQRLYHAEALLAWHGFAQGLLDASSAQPRDERQWRMVLLRLGTREDPFLAVMTLLAERFREESRTPWVDEVIRLQRVLLSSREGKLPEQGIMANVRIAQDRGGEWLHKMADGDMGLRGGAAQLRQDVGEARRLARYQRLLREVIDEALQSDGQALRIAMQTWSYAVSPQAVAAPLWEAGQLLDSLRDGSLSGDRGDRLGWDLVGAGLHMTLSFLGHTSACRLQQDWSAQVLGGLQGVTDPLQRHALLYGPQGRVPAFLEGPLGAFVTQDARGYRSREIMGQSIALQAPFLSFISGMQQARVALEQRTGRARAAERAGEQRELALEQEVQALSEQLAPLQSQLLVLRAGSATVDLSVTPVQLNRGARQLPRRTRLTLQCNGRRTELENFNFPTQASFVWAAQGCADVDLEIDFEHFTLHKRWAGERGFIEFLRTFRDGRYTFGLGDFPAQRDLMEGAGIGWLQLSYRQQGALALLERYGEVDRLESRLAEITARLDSARQLLGEQRRVRNAQSQAKPIGAALVVPEHIADCARAPQRTGAW